MQYKVNLRLVTKENTLLAPEIYYNTALSSEINFDHCLLIQRSTGSV